MYCTIKSPAFIYAAILFFTFSLLSCSTSQVAMEVLVPGDIAVSQEINDVGIVNRSLPADDEKFTNFLEGLFTGESILADKIGSENCLIGLANELHDSPRFNIEIIEGIDLRGTGTREFPALLTWGEVKNLCKTYKVDAMIVLETFDSNIFLEQGEEEKEKKVDGREILVIEYYAELNVDVNAGWRIYDPVNKVIVDQNVYRDHISWYEDDEKPEKVMKRLPSKREAVNQAAIHAGNRYARRISPTWLKVNRAYYTKGHDDFELTKRYVKTNSWDEAANVWQRLVDSPDLKIAGRAAYNMALASEMNGDLEIAIAWAKKSYEECGNKKALHYLRILERRLADQQILQQQMGE
ncbi:MAG: hypothetical protein KAT48_03000 [Bacteroidales bacterium]|nr:hypothetical protein [Bacteroidales bacterium]